jgi:hypothetical protein
VVEYVLDKKQLPLRIDRRWGLWVILSLTVMVLVSGCARSNPGELDTRPTSPAQDLYQGIPVGFTEQGHPHRDSPDAPVTLEEYSSHAVRGRQSSLWPSWRRCSERLKLESDPIRSGPGTASIL